MVSLIWDCVQVTYRRSAPMQKYMQHISQTLRRVSKPNNHYQHHQLPGTPSNDEDRKFGVLRDCCKSCRSVTSIPVGILASNFLGLLTREEIALSRKKSPWRKIHHPHHWWLILALAQWNSFHNKNTDANHVLYILCFILLIISNP